MAAETKDEAMNLEEAMTIWNHRRANPKPDRTEEEIRRDRQAGSMLYADELITYSGGWVVTAKGREAGVR